MDNVILVTFEDEGKAYDEFNALKTEESTSAYTILEMAVVKNVGGTIMVPDGYEDGYDDTNNTGFGGIIGALVGVLGGPVGVLLGTGIGIAAGIALDDKTVDDDESLLEYVAGLLPDGATALALLVREHDEDAFDAQFHETVTIYRWSAEAIAREVEHAEALRDQLAEVTRKEMRAARKAEREA